MNLLSPIINYNYGHNTHALLIIMIIIHKDVFLLLLINVLVIKNKMITIYMCLHVHTQHIYFYISKMILF